MTDQTEQNDSPKEHGIFYWTAVGVAMTGALLACGYAFNRHYNYKSEKSNTPTPGTIEEKVGPGYKLQFRKVND